MPKQTIATNPSALGPEPIEVVAGAPPDTVMGPPAWTEERREPGHGASWPGLRSAGSEATGATRAGREPAP